MSGRASRVVLSVLLLLAVAAPSVLFLPSVRAAPPVVTLQNTAKGQSLDCHGTCTFGVPVVAGGSTLITMYASTTGANNGNITGGTCGSTPMIILANFTTGTFGSLSFAHFYLLYAVGFVPGAYSCGVTIAGAPPAGLFWIYATQAWSNVLQTAPIAQHAQAVGTTQTTYSVTLGSSPGASDTVADFLESCCQLHTGTPNAAQTQQWAQLASANYGQGSTKPGGGTATMSWTVSLANDNWGLYAIDIAAVAPILDTFTYSAVGLRASFVSSVSGGAGGPYNTTWAFGDGGTSYDPNPAHTYATAGTRTVYLNVTDSGSNTASASGSVTVSPGSTSSPPPPPALPPNVVTYPQITQLNCAVVSFSDPRGDAAVASTVLWAYNFGDGSRLAYSPVPTVNHTYAFPRVYRATMTTQDRQGNIQSYGMTVDTTPLGCAVSAIRVVGPPGTLGLAIALLAASLVVPKKSKYAAFRGRFRRAAVVAAGAFLFVVVVFP